MRRNRKRKEHPLVGLFTLMFNFEIRFRAERQKLGEVTHTHGLQKEVIPETRTNLEIQVEHLLLSLTWESIGLITKLVLNLLEKTCIRLIFFLFLLLLCNLHQTSNTLFLQSKDKFPLSKSNSFFLEKSNEKGKWRQTQRTNLSLLLLLFHQRLINNNITIFAPLQSSIIFHLIFLPFLNILLLPASFKSSLCSTFALLFLLLVSRILPSTYFEPSKLQIMFRKDGEGYERLHG